MKLRTIGSMLLILMLVFTMGVSAFATEPVDATIIISAPTPPPDVVEPVADTTPVETPATEDPAGQGTGTEAPATGTDQQTATQPTAAPVSKAFAITKHPYSESIEEGTVTSFVSKATGSASAQWIIQDANGNPGTSAHISVKEPYYDNATGELVAKVVINNASVNINGWSFRTEFYGNNGATARTDAAVLSAYYAASKATPRPVVTPVPTATPSPTPAPTATPAPTPTPEPTETPEPTPLPTFTPVPTVAPLDNAKEVPDGGMSASLGKMLTVIVIAGAAAVIAVVGILAGSGILGGNKKKRRKRR